MHLEDRDAIASTHRGHGHCIAKGCDEQAMMAEIFGKKDGLCGGKGGSMHIADLSKGMITPWNNDPDGRRTRRPASSSS